MPPSDSSPPLSGNPPPPPSAGPAPDGSGPVALARTGRMRMLFQGAAAATAVTLAAVAVISAITAARDGAATPEPAASPTTGAERTVAEFLAAVQDRDVARALEAAGVAEPPSGEQARFLDAGALDSDWEIRSVTERSRTSYSTGEQATVEVTIAAGDQIETTAMPLSRASEQDGSGSAWTIDEPFVHVTFAPSPLAYLDVNGIRAAPPPVDELTPGPEYALLPGRYTVYPEPPEGVIATYTMWRFSPEDPMPVSPQEGMLLLPGAPGVVLGAESFALTDDAEAQVIQAAIDYLDECATSTALSPAECPFGSDGSTRLPDDYVSWDREHDARWDIVEYPTLAVVPGPDRIHLTDRERGVVRLHGTTDSIEPDGGGATVAVECVMITAGMTAEFTADGTITVDLRVGQYETETCAHAVPAE